MLIKVNRLTDIGKHAKESIPIFINSEYITMMMSTLEDTTGIYLLDYDSVIEVEETPEEIIQKIDGYVT